jgi:DNA polymerase III subunit gamma/tau
VSKTPSKALYRKYRSKNLGEVVGQEHIVQVLEAAVKKDKVSHAYLFTGPKGVGKTSIARIFAHQINGIEYGDETTHLDIIEIDAASNSGVDDMRDLKDKIGISPSSLKFKVYIIDEVHMLSGASFAALLKTIEEPPSHAVFILATTDVHKVPATIMSRVQKFFFRPIEQQSVKDHLSLICQKECIKFDDSALSLIAESSEGSMRDALSLLDQVASGAKDVTLKSVQDSLGLAGDEVTRLLADAVLSGQIDMIHSTLQDIIASGADPRSLSLQIYKSLRDKLSSFEEFSILAELLTNGTLTKPALGVEITLLKLASLQADSTSHTKEENSQVRAQTLDIPAPEEKLTVSNKEVRELGLNKNNPSKKITKGPNKADPKEQENTPKESTKNSSEEDQLTSRNLSEKWSEILELVAKLSPSLKAVLKSSTQKVTERTYTFSLELAYPMHLKMIQESKNKQLLMQSFKDCGINLPSFEFSLASKRPSSKKSPESSTSPKANNDSDNSSFSDIISLMGGGEAVGV